MRRYIHSFDRVIMDYLATLSRSYKPFMQFASLIGHPFVTVGLTVSIASYAVIRDDFKLALLCAVAIITFTVSSIMKLWLRRPRPATDYIHTMWLRTFSFPSGHSAGSVASFGLIAYLAASALPIYASAIIALAVVVCFIIGVSRVYLGAHYPSDVIGGWIVGATGVVIIMLIGT